MSKKGNSGTGSGKGWTKADVARVTSAVASKNGGQTPKGSWVTKVQSIVDKRTGS